MLCACQLCKSHTLTTSCNRLPLRHSDTKIQTCLKYLLLKFQTFHAILRAGVVGLYQQRFIFLFWADRIWAKPGSKNLPFRPLTVLPLRYFFLYYTQKKGKEEPFGAHERHRHFKTRQHRQGSWTAKKQAALYYSLTFATNLPTPLRNINIVSPTGHDNRKNNGKSPLCGLGLPSVLRAPVLRNRLFQSLAGRSFDLGLGQHTASATTCSYHGPTHSQPQER